MAIDRLTKGENLRAGEPGVTPFRRPPGRSARNAIGMKEKKGLAMAEIDNDTLLVSLQAVYESINRFETLLDSKTLKDPEAVTELLVSYDEAFKVLKSVYRERLGKGADLPPIESVVFDKA